MKNRSAGLPLIGLLLLFFICALSGAAEDAAPQSDEGPANLDFEQGDSGSVPPGWFQPLPSAAAGYSVVRTDERPRSGSACVLISRPTPPSERAFGNVMQTFDATAYRGRVVRFAAAVRTDLSGPESRAQLWMRVDRGSGRMGFFDNMMERPITCEDWEYFEIVGPIAEDAEDINFGCMLLGAGRIWLDDASFEIVSDVGIGHEPARPLEDRALVNLIAFARLFGYVRYFHPSDEASAADWEALAIEGVRLVEDAQDPADLARRMQRFFAQVAAVVVFPTDAAVVEDPYPADTLKAVAWRHKGVAMSGSHPIYSSVRVNRAEEEGLPDPAEPFRADLEGGVSCSMQLSLYVDEFGTLPRASVAQYDSLQMNPEGFLPSGNDRATRLAGVILAWNVLQHFYPYFDVVSADWRAALPRALRSAATDKDERDFLDTLRRLVAELDDGHGGVYLTGAQATHRLPILWDWVEQNLVITRVADEAAGRLQRGDVVLKVDGRPSEHALEDCEALISAATPQWKRFRALEDLACGDQAEAVALEVQRGRAPPWTVSLERSIPLYGETPLEESRPMKIDEIHPGIFYLDLCRIEDAQFLDTLPQLEKANGIVFDVRGYPKVSTVVIAHLITEPVTSAQWHVPVVTRPDREAIEFEESSWSVAPIEPRLTANVAFLIDGRAISYAETFLGIIEHYKLGAIVGSPTAGTNGNVNPMKLPGGYRMSWTGMKVLKHDGSRHHGIGIPPTDPVSRTIAGVAAGRDEVLERAIELVAG